MFVEAVTALESPDRRNNRVPGVVAILHQGGRGSISRLVEVVQ